MPITASAKKALRQNRRRHTRNLVRKGTIKKTVKGALNASEKERATALASAFKAIDKAAKRGVIKKNTAARKKSRLIKALERKSS